MTLSYKEDLLDGVQTWFYPDGGRMRECEVVYGEVHGYWREWDEGGVLTVDETYKDGVRVIPTGDAPAQNDADANVE